MNIWCFDGITDISELFKDKTDFNEDISGWNTASVTNMKQMFDRAQAFNQTIVNWNTESVEDMSEMFAVAWSFNQPIGNWNTARVAIMEEMFSGASSFNQILCAWRDSFPYGNCNDSFSSSGCTHKGQPERNARGPFCASTCNVSQVFVCVVLQKVLPHDSPLKKP